MARPLGNEPVDGNRRRDRRPDLARPGDHRVVGRTEVEHGVEEPGDQREVHRGRHPGGHRTAGRGEVVVLRGGRG
jgi:hypothetical protein